MDLLARIDLAAVVDRRLQVAGHTVLVAADHVGLGEPHKLMGAVVVAHIGQLRLHRRLAETEPGHMSWLHRKPMAAAAAHKMGPVGHRMKVVGHRRIVVGHSQMAAGRTEMPEPVADDLVATVHRTTAAVDHKSSAEVVLDCTETESVHNSIVEAQH